MTLCILLIKNKKLKVRTVFYTMNYISYTNKMQQIGRLIKNE